MTDIGLRVLKPDIVMMRIFHRLGLIQDRGKDIHKAQTNEAFFASVLSINLDGKEVPAIIKDMQRHPARDIILHADFLRIDPNKKISIHVPLHFINQEQCKGVKEGGVISHSSTDMEISCLPSDLPEYIEVDMQDTPSFVFLRPGEGP